MNVSGISFVLVLNNWNMHVKKVLSTKYRVLQIILIEVSFFLGYDLNGLLSYQVHCQREHEIEIYFDLHSFSYYIKNDFLKL